MSLFGGLKFTPKGERGERKQQRRGVADDDNARGGQPLASAVDDSAASSGRMDWMVNPVNLFAPRPGAGEQMSEEELNEERRQKKAKEIMDEEIRSGLRDPVSGLRFGLTKLHTTASRSQGGPDSASGKQGDPTKVGMLGMGHSSADRLAARRKREDQKSGPELTPALVGDVLSRVSEPAAGSSASSSAPSSRRRPPVFGDGGASWRAKALQRAQERAAEQGRDVDAVVAERWGSKEELLRPSERERGESRGGGFRDRFRSRRADREAERGRDRSRDREDRHRRRRRDHDDRSSRNPGESRSRHRGGRHSRSRSRERRTERESSRERGDAERTQRTERTTQSKMAVEKDRILRKMEEEQETAKRKEMEAAAARAAERQTFLYGSKRAKKTEEETSVPKESREEVAPAASVRSPAEKTVPARRRASSLTSDELNRLEARVLRAEMMGRADEAERLRQEIAAARAGASESAPAPRTAASRHDTLDEPDVRVVPTVDRQGRPIESLASGREAPLERADLRRRSRGKAGPAKDTVAADGSRTKYFASDPDASASLEELLRFEKTSKGQSLDESRTRAILRQGQKFREAAGSSTGADEDEDMDALVASWSTGDERLTARARQAKDRKRAIQSMKRDEQQEARDPYNMKGPLFQKHLILSLGELSFLMLPPGPRLNADHVQIVPIEQVPSMRQADEGLYAEVLRFKEALDTMFRAEGKTAVFVETCMFLQRASRTVIEVAALDEEMADECPVFFEKAMKDVEEWTQHRPVISTTGKGLRRSIPEGFPYVHVSWRGGGVLHVIEDERSFPRHFGMDTVAGMLGLPPHSFGRKDRKNSFETDRAAVMAFLKRWKPYDWTEELDG